MKKLAVIVFFATLSLILIGLIIVMSASSTYSATKFNSAFYLFNQHLYKVIFGFAMLVVFSFVPYEWYKKISKPAIMLTALLLLVTLLIAPQVKGSGRWLNLGFTTIQPSDIAKLVLIIHLAFLLERKRDYIKDLKNGYMALLVWVIIIVVLIFFQPNVSTALLITAVSLTMIFVGGAKLKHVLLSSLGLLISAGTLVMLFPHSKKRILSFISSFGENGELAHQVKQGVISLGSGGLFGLGIGGSKQSNLFLPESYGDFILAILGEETGFVGVIVVLFLYLTLFAAGILIAKKAKDRFGQMLAFGITYSIIIYAFANTAVATGSLPATGFPLPFISYGGTSVVFLCISIGILINIAISNYSPENSKLKSKETNSFNKPALAVEELSK
ncbi:MAG: FtsW/RodA/SpoVE family cell cycle protein [Ignavibacteriaceae bacterium]|jgi:cell division protein FtsW|nr:FtsW/RodA/SpoVE family cell cycle protein [Ignavibacteriaceae bacterium]